MTITHTKQMLVERAGHQDIALPEVLVERLVVYFDLLQRWNETINLTALTGTPEGIDRLLVEPVAAASHLPSGVRLLDVGSGGGSPAIPLAMASAASILGMVESRGRKAAFLREASRQLELNATVYSERIEDLCARPTFGEQWDIVSARGIRLDSPLLTSVAAALQPGSVLALFVSKPVPVPLPFAADSPRQLLRGADSYLVLAHRR